MLELYRMYASRRFCSATPTLFNAGTPHSQLSSCYLYVVDDTLESIVQPGDRRERDVLEVGGRPRRLVDGGPRHRLAHRAAPTARARASIPFLKLHNDQLVAVNQGGKRAGRGLRLPRGLAQRHPRLPRAAPQHRRRAPPHPRHEHGLLDARSVHEAHGGARALDAVPQLRRPRPARDLRRGVRAALRRLRAAAQAGAIFGERIEALELWKQMLQMLFETGHPWITFKDPVQRAQPAGPRRGRPLLEPLHRDHAQHERGGDRGLQPRLDRRSTSTSPPTARSTTRSSARRSASRCARSTT